MSDKTEEEREELKKKIGQSYLEESAAHRDGRHGDVTLIAKERLVMQKELYLGDDKVDILDGPGKDIVVFYTNRRPDELQYFHKVASRLVDMVGAAGIIMNRGDKVERLPSLSIALARKFIADKFKSDPSFKQTYIANVAMLLHDRKWLKRPLKDRNEAAEAVLDLIFEDKR